MKQHKIFWQIFPAYIAVVVASLVVVLYFSTNEIQKLNLRQKQRYLASMADVIAERVAIMSDDQIHGYCKSVGGRIGYRITIITTGGNVLGDTEKNPRLIENHIDRSEIQEALQGQTGTAVRFSDTTKKYMLYVAVPVLNSAGETTAVARVSISNESINELVDSVLDSVINTAFITALAAAVISFIISRRISRPLALLRDGAKRFANGDLDYRLLVEGSYETSSLARTMNNMASELNGRIKYITEQQTTQNAILSSMTEAVIAVDNRKVVIMANNAAMELFGMPSESVGRPIEEAARDPELHKVIDRMFSTKSGVLDMEMIVFKQERQIALQVHGTSLKVDGLQTGVLIVLSNVTQLKRLENIRKEFVANVSHELKTPITSIKGFVETLRDGAINDKAKAVKFLDIIARQTSRLDEIIDDLLVLSRIEQLQDNRQVESAKALIKTAIYGALAVCKTKADAKGICVNITCSEDAAAKISPSLLEQAVVNLVDNAIKYSDDGAAIEISGCVEGPEAVISVKDYGCGIPEDDLDRIFERFYRVDKSRSAERGGTGLGLAIVKHIVSAYKGSVAVESRQNRGSKFTIKLESAK